MKRILSIFLAVTLLLVSGVAYAEQSAQAYSGNSDQIRTGEFPVYIMAINDTGGDIPAGSYSVVIVDTDKITTSGVASNQIACYFTTSTTPGDALVTGVTAGDAIGSGELGRIIVRGPALVDLLASHTIAYVAGSTMCVSSVAAHADSIPNAAIRAARVGDNKDPYHYFGAFLAGYGDDYNEGLIDASTKTMQGWVWIH